MNKIAGYLNEHIVGEITSDRAVRKHYSTDASIFTITPEVVVFPRVTNDIRKVARFAWQLAEKGHAISLTPRGLGKDTTGAAIGKGIVIDLSSHLDDVIQVIPKDRLVHVQPGVRIHTLAQILKWQGLSLVSSSQDATIGGVIANDSMGASGAVSDSVEKFEVILANGDLIETGRISKRELSKKLGLQTFEGEVYRKIEGLIEDNQDLIRRLADDPARDNTGYPRIAEVRQKDGSFDLTPLFIGSQGTLGIISEIVLKTDFYSEDETCVAITTSSVAEARDIADKLTTLEPAELFIYDGDYVRRTINQAKHHPLFGDLEQLGAVIIMRFDDFSSRAQAGKLKKARKILKKTTVGIIDSTEHPHDDFHTLADLSPALTGVDGDKVAVPVIDGAFIPANRREEFEVGLSELAHKQHLELPIALDVLSGTYRIITRFKLDAVSDKQKLFRLVTDFASLVDSHNGAVASDGAEGRLKAIASWGLLDPDEVQLYEDIRRVFDPFGTLNPDVKQKNDLRSLIASLRSSYDAF